MNTFVQKGHRLSSLVVVSLGLAGATACDKVEDIITPKLPEATQEGKNTFGCLVDEKLWLPYTEHTLDNAVEGDYSDSDNTFMLRAENEAPNNFRYIHLYVANVGTIKPGTYTLGNGFSATYDAATRYTTPAGSSGSITITKVEPVVNTGGGSLRYTIVSGTFGFTAVDAAGKTVTVKDGRFDVKAF